MTSFTPLLRSLAVASIALMPLPATAEEPDAGERESIRMMIRDQIAAFLRDDGEAAFAHASPGIQELFASSAERFMAMVQQGYAPVYRARSVMFGRLFDADGTYFQSVYLIGPKGKNWIAAYGVEQQDDGSWRINGVQLAPDTKGSAI